MQALSSITIMPPEPMIEPTSFKRFVVHRKIEKLFRDAAAGGPAGLHRFELVALGYAAANFKNDLAQGQCPWALRSGRHFALSRRAQIPSCLCFSSCRCAAYHSPPRRRMVGMLAKVSTLLISVGQIPQVRTVPETAAEAAACRAGLQSKRSARSLRRRRMRRRRCGFQCRS